MSGDKEVKVQEQVVEKVTDKAISIETTAVSEVTIALSGVIGLNMISESSLTDDQKKLATEIYDSIKTIVQSFITDSSLNNTIKITKTIGYIIKQLENIKIDGKAPTGTDKKEVAIQLGRIFIKEVTPDDKDEADILIIYDLVAESILEAMIDVSRVVNVAVQKMAIKCCPSILELFKRSKTVETSKATETTKVTETVETTKETETSETTK